MGAYAGGALYALPSVVTYLYPLTRVLATALEGRAPAVGRILQHSPRACQCSSSLHPGTEFSLGALLRSALPALPLAGCTVNFCPHSQFALFMGAPARVAVL